MARLTKVDEALVQYAVEAGLARTRHFAYAIDPSCRRYTSVPRTAYNRLRRLERLGLVTTIEMSGEKCWTTTPAGRLALSEGKEAGTNG